MLNDVAVVSLLFEKFQRHDLCLMTARKVDRKGRFLFSFSFPKVIFSISTCSTSISFHGCKMVQISYEI